MGGGIWKLGCYGIIAKEVMSLVLVLYWFKTFDIYSPTPIAHSGLDPCPQVTLYIVKLAMPLGLWMLPPKPHGHRICDQTTIKVLHSSTPSFPSCLFCHIPPGRTAPGITLLIVVSGAQIERLIWGTSRVQFGWALANWQDFSSLLWITHRQA